jgi:hypothetical protein
MSFQSYPAFQLGFQQLGAGAGAAEGPSVVLFPSEPLRFRSRWDKTAYAWGIFVRDMRAPTDGFRPMKDHLVSAVALAAR